MAKYSAEDYIREMYEAYRASGYSDSGTGSTYAERANNAASGRVSSSARDYGSSVGGQFDDFHAALQKQKEDNFKKAAEDYKKRVNAQKTINADQERGMKRTQQVKNQTAEKYTKAYEKALATANAKTDQERGKARTAAEYAKQGLTVQDVVGGSGTKASTVQQDQERGRNRTIAEYQKLYEQASADYDKAAKENKNAAARQRAAQAVMDSETASQEDKQTAQEYLHQAGRDSQSSSERMDAAAKEFTNAYEKIVDAQADSVANEDSFRAKQEVLQKYVQSNAGEKATEQLGVIYNQFEEWDKQMEAYVSNMVGAKESEEKQRAARQKFLEETEMSDTQRAYYKDPEGYKSMIGDLRQQDATMSSVEWRISQMSDEEVLAIGQSLSEAEELRARAEELNREADDALNAGDTAKYERLQAQVSDLRERADSAEAQYGDFDESGKATIQNRVDIINLQNRFDEEKDADTQRYIELGMESQWRPTLREAIEQTLNKVGFIDSAERLISKMTDEEKDIYYYYVARDTEAAQQYFSAMETTLESRVNAETAAYATEHPYMALGVNTLAAPVSWVMSAGLAAESVLTGESAGTASIQGTLNATKEGSIAGMTEDFQNTFGFSEGASNLLASTIVSILENAAQSTAFRFDIKQLSKMGLTEEAFNAAIAIDKAVPLAMMGTKAGAETVMSQMDEGIPAVQALLYGAGVGLVEVWTENIGFDNWIDTNTGKLSDKVIDWLSSRAIDGKLGRLSYTKLRSAILGVSGWVSQVGSEGFEEATSEITDGILDLIINREDSQFYQDMQNAKTLGYADDKLVPQAILALLKRTGVSALGGALSGGVMGASGALSMSMNANAIGESILNADGQGGYYTQSDASLAPQLIADGMAFAEGTNTNAFANRLYSQVMEGGEALSAGDISTLYYMMESDMQSHSESLSKATATEQGKAALSEVATEVFRTGTVSATDAVKVSNVLSDIAAGKDITDAQIRDMKLNIPAVAKIVGQRLGYEYLTEDRSKASVRAAISKFQRESGVSTRQREAFDDATDIMHEGTIRAKGDTARSTEAEVAEALGNAEASAERMVYEQTGAQAENAATADLSYAMEQAAEESSAAEINYSVFSQAVKGANDAVVDSDIMELYETATAKLKGGDTAMVPTGNGSYILLEKSGNGVSMETADMDTIRSRLSEMAGRDVTEDELSEIIGRMEASGTAFSLEDAAEIADTMGKEASEYRAENIPKYSAENPNVVAELIAKQVAPKLKRFGINEIVVDYDGTYLSEGENGKYVDDTGVIYLNGQLRDGVTCTFAEGVKTVKYMNAASNITRILGHEITHPAQGMHYKRSLTQERTEAIIRLYQQYTGMTDAEVEARVNHLKDVYRKHASKMGVDAKTISTEYARQEFAADAMGIMLMETNALQNLSEKDGGLGRSILKTAREFRSMLSEKRLDKGKGNYRDALRVMRQTTADMVRRLEGMLEDTTAERSQTAERYEAAQKETAEHEGDVRRSIPDEAKENAELFANDIQEWHDNGRRYKETFILGSTGTVLQGLGAAECDIYMLSDKIEEIQNGKRNHPEMTLDVIKRIPDVLNDPILVMRSNTRYRADTGTTRLTMFGSVTAEDGRPVMVVLDLRPVENGYVVDGMQKVNSAYTKDTNPAGFIQKSDILYADKKRTTPLLRTIGLEMPTELQRSGYIGSITYGGQNVKIDGTPFSELFAADTGETAENTRKSLADDVDGNDVLRYNGSVTEVREDAGEDQLHRASGEGVRGSEFDETHNSLKVEVQNDGRADLQSSGVLLVSEASKRIIEERGFAFVAMHDVAQDKASFSNALDAAIAADEKNGWCVDPKPVEALSEPGMKPFLSDGGFAGFVVTGSGDIEGVFANKKAGAPKRSTMSMIPQAIALGGKTLDCYGIGLVNVYANFGFEPVARVPFNEEYVDHDRWDESKGRPDVIVMIHNGDSADAVVEKYFDYRQWTPEEVNALPVYEDYGEAIAYRDRILEERSTKAEPETGERYSVDEATIRPLDQRVSGDDLLNAQDLIDTIEDVNGEVDENGYVTIYHRTNEKAAKRIYDTGRMVAKEDGLFFSTKPDGQNIGYGDSVITLRVPVESLILDDIFSDEVHLRYPLEGGRRSADVSEYLVEEADSERYSLNSDSLYDTMKSAPGRGIVWNDGNAIKLAKSEYARLISTINTEYYSANKTHEGIQIAYSSASPKGQLYAYLYEDHGFGAYSVIGKISFKNHEALISELREMIDNNDETAEGLRTSSDRARIVRENAARGLYDDSNSGGHSGVPGQNYSGGGLREENNGRDGNADTGGYDEGSNPDNGGGRYSLDTEDTAYMGAIMQAAEQEEAQRQELKRQAAATARQAKAKDRAAVKAARGGNAAEAAVAAREANALRQEAEAQRIESMTYEEMVDEAMKNSGTKPMTPKQMVEQAEEAAKARLTKKYSEMTPDEKRDELIRSIMRKNGAISGGKKVSRVATNTFANGDFFQGVVTAAGEELQKVVEGLATYDPVSEKQSVTEAAHRLDTNYMKWFRELPEKQEWTGVDHDTAMMILSQIQKNSAGTGDYTDVIRWAKIIQEHGTTTGRALQSFAKYTRTAVGVMMKQLDMIDQLTFKDGDQKGVESELKSGIEASNKKIKELQRKYDSLNEDNKKLLAELEKRLSELDEAKSDRREAGKALTETKQKIKATMKSIENYQQKIDALNAENEKTMAELEELLAKKADLKGKASELMAERSKLARRVRAAEAAIDRTTQMNEHLRDTIDALTGKKGSADAALSVLKGDNKVLADLLMNLTGVGKEATSLKTNIRKASNLADTRKKIAEASKTMREAMKDMDDLLSKASMTEKKQWLIRQTIDYANLIDKVQEGDKEGLYDLICRIQHDRGWGYDAGRVMGKIRGHAMEIKARDKKTFMAQDFQWLNNFAINALVSLSDDYRGRAVGDKVKAWQYIAQLLNPKTWERNIISNTAFYGLEAATNNTVGLLADMIAGIFTGKRSVGMTWGAGEMFSTVKAGKARANQSKLQARYDVSGNKTKYEGSSSNRTFKIAQNQIIRSTLEKLNAYGLNVTDEFFKGMTYQSMMNSYARLVEKGKLTMEEAIQLCEEEMLYRTFQDETIPGIVLNGLYRVLNVGGKLNFGPGDIVVKYRTVPGALIDRAIEFSPLGLMKFIYHTGSLVKSGGENILEQREVAMAAGRTITGSALAVLFAFLAKNLVLRRKEDEEDKDVGAMDSAQGRTGTQVNLSAIGRYFDGEENWNEWREGDMLQDIGFLDPIGSTMTWGALFNSAFWENSEGLLSSILSSSYKMVTSAFSDLSMMDTVNDLIYAVMYGDDAIDTTQRALVSLATSFATGLEPSILRNIAQASDNNYRDTYATGGFVNDLLGDSELANGVQRAVNSMMNNIPGLRQQLNTKLDPLGNERVYNAGGVTTASWLHTMFNPGRYTRLQETELQAELKRVYEANGEQSFYPDRNAPNSIQFGKDQNGDAVRHQLTYEQKREYLQDVGEIYKEILAETMGNEGYQNANAAEQAEMLQEIKQYSEFVAKRAMNEKYDINPGWDDKNGNHVEGWEDNTWKKTEEGMNAGFGFTEMRNILKDVGKYEGEKDENGDTKSGSRDDQILDYLSESSYSDEERLTLYGIINGGVEQGSVRRLNILMSEEFTYEKNGESVTAAGAQLTWNDAVSVVQMYHQLRADGSETDLNEQTEMNRWLRQNGYSEEQIAAINEQYKFYGMIPQQENSAMRKLIDMGMDDDTAYSIAGELAGLEPVDGSEEVEDWQKYDAILSGHYSDDEVNDAFRAMAKKDSMFPELDDATTKKLITAYKNSSDDPSNRDGSIISMSVSKIVKYTGTEYKLDDDQKQVYRDAYLSTFNSIAGSMDVTGQYTNSSGESTLYLDKVKSICAGYAAAAVLRSSGVALTLSGVKANGSSGVLLDYWKVSTAQQTYGISPQTYVEIYGRMLEINYQYPTGTDGQTAAMRNMVKSYGYTGNAYNWMCYCLGIATDTMKKALGVS